MNTEALLSAISQFASTSSSLQQLQKFIVEATADNLSTYSWIGFYMLDPQDPNTLQLGPFVGEPTPHVRIPLTQGICGAAAATGKTTIVDDVGEDPRYLSCSLSTKSEIVVPIFVGGKVVGEIDVDSHLSAAFGEVDRKFLEQTAKIVGEFIESHSAS